MTFVQSIKGAPASVLLALGFTRRPMTSRELRDWTGYSDKSVADATRRLADLGWIKAYSRYGPWSMAPGRPLVDPRISAAPHLFSEPSGGISGDPSGISAPEDGISASSSSSGYLDANHSSHDPLPLELETAEIPPFEHSFSDNLQALLDAGIGEPAASRLARMPHVTPAYVRDHVEQVLEERKGLGAAIYRMQCGWAAPSRKKKDWDAEAVNAKIQRFLNEPR
jgi:hypothetical protein